MSSWCWIQVWCWWSHISNHFFSPEEIFLKYLLLNYWQETEMVPQNIDKSFNKQIKTMENLFWKLFAANFSKQCLRKNTSFSPFSVAVHVYLECSVSVSALWNYRNQYLRPPVKNQVSKQFKSNFVLHLHVRRIPCKYAILVKNISSEGFILLRYTLMLS